MAMVRARARIHAGGHSFYEETWNANRTKYKKHTFKCNLIRLLALGEKATRKLRSSDECFVLDSDAMVHLGAHKFHC